MVVVILGVEDTTSVSVLPPNLDISRRVLRIYMYIAVW